ncbi:polysaccharide biosynthesis tyrosine autokinase [Georgenia sp. MJ206]|uniref:polysaccharide biosynthesis tyrosine autokinase n=1 Tax=Georgenia wangjunii TaxID=3117730 RepID=UPI002F26DBF0
MELGSYLHLLRTRWLTVAVVCLATLLAAAVATLMTTPQYTSSTRLFFAVQGGESVSDLAQGSTFTEKQMSSYAEVAQAPLVVDPVAEALGGAVSPEAVADALTVSVAPDTTILNILATHTNPATARDIANGVAIQLVATVGGLSPDSASGNEAVRATKLSDAELAHSPSAPHVPRNLTLGFLLGLLLGIGVALLRELLDTKVRSEVDLAALTEASVIGAIRFDEKTEAHPIVMHDDPHGQRAEAYRRLRTNLQFLDLAERPSSVVVTSAIPGEGKSTTAANLAVALADAGTRVILVDADLRRPSIADYAGIEGRVGLTTVLIGRAEIDDVVQPWKNTTLDLMPAGQIPPNPSELLGSRAMTHLLKQLTDRYDIVIIDSPPLLPVTDAAVLSNQVGGMLVVVGADRVHKAQVRDSLESLETVDAHVLGLVINKVAKADGERYGYSYDSYRPHDPSDRGAAKASRRRQAKAAPRA